MSGKNDNKAEREKGFQNFVECVRQFRDENLPDSSVVVTDDPKYPNHMQISIIEEGKNKELGSLRSSLDLMGFVSTGNKIGNGCWGKVDEYVDRHGKKWAVKVLSPNEYAQAQRSVRKLSLNNILEREENPVDSALYNVVPSLLVDSHLLMRKYDRTLEDLLAEKGGRLDVNETIKIMRAMLNALSYTHSKLGKVHGDIKPDNILLTEDGIAMLGDFGVSSPIDPQMQSKDSRGNIGWIYTRSYMNFNGIHKNERSDVFALGALFGRLIAGKYVHQERIEGNENPDKAMASITREEAESDTKRYSKSIPKPFRRFFERCISFNSEDRYKNGCEMRQAFESSVLQYERARPIERLKRWGTALAGGIVLATAAAIPLGLSLKNANNEKTHLEQKVDEALKYTVVSDWDDNLEIQNNLMDLKIDLSDEKFHLIYGGIWTKEAKFPKFLELKKGQPIRINSYAFLKPIVNKKGLAFPYFPGKAYIEGYEAKEFFVHPQCYRRDYSGMGVHSGGFNDKKLIIPREIPDGTYNLIIELYSQEKGDPPNTVTALSFTRFQDPGKTIARKKIPIIIGNPSEKLELCSLDLNGYTERYSIGNVGSLYELIKSDLTSDISMFSLGDLGVISLRGNYSNALADRITMPYVDKNASSILQIVARQNGNPVFYSFIPVKSEKVTDSHWYWKMDLPDRDFPEKCIELRKKIYERRTLENISGVGK